MTSKADKKQLLAIAREALVQKLNNKEYTPDFTNLCDIAFLKKGVYVVFIEDNYLRSVSGYLEPKKEVYKGIIENAINAGFYSAKAKHINKDDLNKIIIEISILSDVKKLHYNDPQDLLSKLNKDLGVVIKKGMQNAVFLPTMWKVYPEPEEFMSALCGKMGFTEKSWNREPLDIYVFTAETFAEDLE